MESPRMELPKIWIFAAPCSVISSYEPAVCRSDSSLPSRNWPLSSMRELSLPPYMVSPPRCGVHSSSVDRVPIRFVTAMPEATE